MSTMNELDAVIRDLRQAAESLTATANKLEAMRDTPDTDVPTEESKHELTLQEVQSVFRQLARDGYNEQLKKLIRSRGVMKLSEIPSSEYEELVKAAEGIPNG